MEQTVIRIENKEGFGHFCGLSVNYNINLRSMIRSHREFNEPSEDRLDLWRNNKEWFCAYKRASQILGLILEREMNYLICLGFKVWELGVTEYQEGDDQFIFTRESIISKKDITVKITNAFKYEGTSFLK